MRIYLYPTVSAGCVHGHTTGRSASFNSARIGFALLCMPEARNDKKTHEPSPNFALLFYSMGDTPSCVSWHNSTAYQPSPLLDPTRTQRPSLTFNSIIKILLRRCTGVCNTLLTVETGCWSLRSVCSIGSFLSPLERLLPLTPMHAAYVLKKELHVTAERGPHCHIHDIYYGRAFINPDPAETEFHSMLQCGSRNSRPHASLGSILH